MWLCPTTLHRITFTMYLNWDQPFPIAGLLHTHRHKHTDRHILKLVETIYNTRLAFPTLDLKAWWDHISSPGAIIKNHSNEPTCAHNALQRGQPSQYLPLTCPIVPMQMSSARSQWDSAILLWADLHTLAFFLHFGFR